MAYDAESDRIILFGGRGTSVGSETWAYDVNTNTWARMGATGPSARYGTAMVYVPGLDRVILFGGFESSTGDPSNETWAYNFNADAWTKLLATNSPSPRGVPALAYDSASGEVILFGGNTGVVPNNETWSYDPQTLTWTLQSPTLKPSPRERYDMVYVSTLDRVVLFGGATTSGLSNETWTYDFDNETWTEMNPGSAPSPRQGHRMVYDTQANRVILLGGDSGTRNSETWAYDFGTDNWTKLNPALAPAGRMVHRMAYDIESDRTVLFGGEWPFGGVANDETWAYDYGANIWAPLTQPIPRPSARAPWAMAYDAESDRVVLFGGLNGGDVLGDTWAYDLNVNTWVNMAPPSAPARRGGHAMAYDTESDRVVLFGGWAGGGVAAGYNDTWTYDYNGNTWTRMNPQDAPSVRWGNQLAYDAESDRVVLLGGHFGGGTAAVLFNDTWSYDVNSDTWTEMSPVPGSDTANWHSMVYDSESDRIVRFGGQTSSDGSFLFTNDTLAYDLNNDTWVLMAPQPRPSARWFHAIAYDEGSDRVVLFGGEQSNLAKPQETWSYDLNADAWILANPTLSPSRRTGLAMTYDAESDRVVLFGGWPTDDPDNETWAYDYESNTWTPMAAPPSAPRNLAAAIDGGVALSWDLPSFEGSHPIHGYWIRRSNAAPVFVEGRNVLTYTDTNVAEGASYAYRVSSENAAGESSPSNQASVSIPDVTIPTIAITSPAAGALLASRSVAVTGTAADNVAVDRIELSADGTNWVLATGTTSWSGVVTVPEGPNTIRARATDGTGNQVEATVAVVADVTPPTVGITTVIFPVGTTTISGTASDNVAVAKVEVSTDGVNWVLAQGTTSWSATVTLSESSFDVYARATDTVGNVGSVAYVHGDRPPPVNVFLLVVVAAAGVAAAGVGAVLWLRRRRRR